MRFKAVSIKQKLKHVHLCIYAFNSFQSHYYKASFKYFLFILHLTFNYQAELLSYTLQTKQNLPNRGYI